MILLTVAYSKEFGRRQRTFRDVVNREVFGDPIFPIASWDLIEISYNRARRVARAPEEIASICLLGALYYSSQDKPAGWQMAIDKLNDAWQYWPSVSHHQKVEIRVGLAINHYNLGNHRLAKKHARWVVIHPRDAADKAFADNLIKRCPGPTERFMRWVSAQTHRHLELMRAMDAVAQAAT